VVVTGEGPRVARLIEVTGIVQAVGFRPFVYRLAQDLALDGRVRNAAGRVEIEVAGPAGALDRFADRLRAEAPPRARVERVLVRDLADDLVPGAGSGFTIVESTGSETAERLFPPDIATCDDCLRELWEPADRRYRYPFTNCTNCGPRATIIEDLPYDRARTSMSEFPLCADCEREYRDPGNRRFHAEPVACPVCGPRLAYRPTGAAEPTAHGEDALAAAVADLAAGRIVAVKGLGGYHLATDATDDAAVERLRDRKHRWAKPFAVMVRDLAAARAAADPGAGEEALLASPARPIVLVRRRTGAPSEGRAAPAVTAGTDRGGLGRPVPGDRRSGSLAEAVTRSDLRVGLFLPYTPLHHLLLAAIGRPIVLTSGNLSDEPLATDDDEAVERLSSIADAFLQHDRRIRARYDDSVTRVVAGRESILRRGRGYAPDTIDLPHRVDEPLLAAGAELKHTFTLARGTRGYVAPHTGDLEDLMTFRAFEGNLAHLEQLLALEPRRVVHDLHPAYLSTQFAVGHFPPEARLGVQHHHAHIASCAAEHGITGPVIGVAYDGLGLGDDGTLWGGEILVADLAGYRRFARFATAPMPGGSMAVHKPYRMALGYLLGPEQDDGVMRVPSIDLPDLAAAFLSRLDPREVQVVRTQVARRLNAPLASSAGRLYDAASSLLGIRDVVEYEAQAAIELEAAAARSGDAAGTIAEDGAMEPGSRSAAGDALAAPPEALPYRLVTRSGMLVYDPVPTLGALLGGLDAGAAPGRLAARFQETIAIVTLELCAAARRATGIRTVCLSGGVMQNQWLATALLDRLGGDGFEAFINRRVPVNDGGVSYGQAAIAAARMAAG
jgi:hydrogenase maturation protein HypF